MRQDLIDAGWTYLKTQRTFTRGKTEKYSKNNLLLTLGKQYFELNEIIKEGTRFLARGKNIDLIDILEVVEDPKYTRPFLYDFLKSIG